jgi:hypothetical protein
VAAQDGNGVGVEALRAESRLAASPAAGLPASGLLAVYAVLATIVVAPILSVRVPGLGDYLNHLARIHILTTIGTSPALQRFYDTHWHLVPYLGMDLPVALLAQVMPIYTAGRIFVAMCVLVPVAGAAVLRYVAYGRVGIVPAFAFLLSYNFVLSNGFLNYLFSAGLAVILFALWVASCGWPRWRRAALFVPAAPLLYLQHPFSFLAYGILVAGFELGRVVRARSFSWPQAALDLAAAALQVVPVACLVLWLAPAAMLGAGAITVFGSLSSKINSLLNTMRFPGNPVIMALTVLVPLGGVMLLRRDIRLAPALAPALLALAIAACCMPSVLFGAWGADFRLTLVAAIVLVGIAAPAPNLQRRKAIAIMAAAACIVAIRSADAFVMLRRFDNQVSQIAQLVAQLPVGSKLLVVEGPADAPLRVTSSALTGHIGLVAAIDRDAFVPFLFTGVTPVRVRAAYRDDASADAAAVSLEQFRASANTTPPPGPLPAWQFGGQMYWLGWPTKFDYVLITHYGAPPGPLPPFLHLVRQGKIADLYSVAN